jgi:hypothetical protein
LRALVKSKLTRAIPEEVLDKILNQVDVDERHRLALVTWHFDGGLHPLCTGELVAFVYAIYEHPRCVEVVTKEIHVPFEETHEVFISTIRRTLVRSLILTLCVVLTRARNGAGISSPKLRVRVERKLSL